MNGISTFIRVIDEFFPYLCSLPGENIMRSLHPSRGFVPETDVLAP